MAPAAAHASAWAPPPGGTVISSTVTGVRETESFTDTEIYVEAPITARYSAVVVPRLEFGRTLDPNDPSVSARVWRGEALIAAKAQLWRGARSVLSVEAGPVYVHSPGDPCPEVDGEARVLAGTARGRAFADVEAAHRQRSGCRSEKLDLTLGWRPLRRWMALAQTFVDQERFGGPAVNVQMSLVRFTKKESGLQLGVRLRVDGEGRGERAFVVGWWNAPRR